MLKKCHIKNIMTLNKKKSVLIILIILLLFIYRWLPKNYEVKYRINKYNITEKYIKKDKMYLFKIEKNKKVYETISTKKYEPKRKLISGVKNYESDDTSCVVITSKKIDDNIICLKSNQRIAYNLTNILPKKYYKKYDSYKTSYKNIKAQIVDNKKYFIWNYKGFIVLNKTNKDVIKLLNNDVYNINLVTILDKYLVMADYNQEYNFNKLLLINMENNDVDKIDLKEDISFDSKIIGTYKNNIYIIDEKNKKEYEINIKKEEMNVISRNKMGQILKNGKWIKMKLNKIITDNITFQEKKNITYKIDNGLYLYQRNIKKPIKISEKNVKNIVYQNDKEVYYISEDSLYKYDFKHGENKILNYFELNFNYENMVFIY